MDVKCATDALVFYMFDRISIHKVNMSDLNRKALLQNTIFVRGVDGCNEMMENVRLRMRQLQY